MRYSTTCNKHSNFFVHYVLEYFIFLFVLFTSWLAKRPLKYTLTFVRGSAFAVAIDCNRSLCRCRRDSFPLFFQGCDCSTISRPLILANLQSIATYLTRRVLDWMFREIDPRIPQTILAIISDHREQTKSILANDSLNFWNRGARILANDSDHSRLSRHGYYWSVPLDVLSWSCVRTWREGSTRAAIRGSRRCRARTGRDVEWIDRQVLAPAESADVRKTFLSPFACAIFLRRERGRSGEWRSYLPGRTGDTATLIRAPCNGKPMNFSSNPLATLFFLLVPARVRPDISLFLSSLVATAGNPPGSGFASSSAPQLTCASVLPLCLYPGIAETWTRAYPSCLFFWIRNKCEDRIYRVLSILENLIAEIFDGFQLVVLKIIISLKEFIFQSMETMCQS